MSDDPRLAQLIQSLRSLAADSPERQSRLEKIARAYTAGTYAIDPEVVAAKIVEELLKDPERS